MPERGFDVDYVWQYFAEVDRMNPDGLLQWYADDASLRFANQQPARGKAAIGPVLQQFYDSIRSMRHEPQGVWVDADSGATEASVHFTTGDFRELVIPAVSVLRCETGWGTISASSWTPRRCRTASDMAANPGLKTTLLRRLCPRLRAEVVDDCGHFVPDEQPFAPRSTHPRRSDNHSGEIRCRLRT